MAKSTSLQRLLTNTTIKSFEDREKVLDEAKREAFNSRLGTYLALAYAYQWWLMSKDDRLYMEQKFKSAEIKVSDLETTNFLVPTIKLIFDLNEPTYYSRVTEYALVLQYVHRKMDEETYEDAAACPSLAVEIIKKGKGIRKCAEAQRQFNNPKDENEPPQTDLEAFLQKVCTNRYNGKESDGAVNIPAPKSSAGLVLMVGRPDQNNLIDIVDV
ncbi:MAG: hypothetical protein AB3N28_10575, partial [Kordiimonas sp.]